MSDWIGDIRNREDNQRFRDEFLKLAESSDSGETLVGVVSETLLKGAGVPDATFAIGRINGRMFMSETLSKNSVADGICYRVDEMN